jgi:homoserine O-succinyltransferase/O-acetyltransferase
MPVLIDRGPAGGSIRNTSERLLELGLVNNMSDAALESTERQFLELLQAASQDIPVRLRLYSLPDVPRTPAGREHLSAGYRAIDELWNSRLDGLIVTGTEPRAPVLSDEPYWGSLTRVIAWAQENTASTVWSCLAAHAAVLHMDGIDRDPREEKLSGVFDCARASDHPLLAGLPARIRIPHSRCNGLHEQTLESRGYTVLTRSTDAGVDAFVKQGKSLFVLFQGHPEYDERALLREYRRDVGRYLRRERETYPAVPHGYFDVMATDALAAFRERARLTRDERLLDSFPTALLERHLRPLDRAPVSRLYRNWLSYLRAHRRPAPRASASPQPRRADAPLPAEGVS